jgi:hypothetical protein
LQSSTGTPTSHDRASAVGGDSLWANGGGVGGGAPLLSLLGSSDPPAIGAPSASSSGFGLVGAFDALQPTSTQQLFDPRPQASSLAAGSSFLSGLPATASLLTQPQQLPGGNSWHSGGTQQSLGGLSLWGGSGLGALPGAGAVGDSLLVR